MQKEASQEQLQRAWNTRIAYQKSTFLRMFPLGVIHLFADGTKANCHFQVWNSWEPRNSLQAPHHLAILHVLQASSTASDAHCNKSAKQATGTTPPSCWGTDEKNFLISEFSLWEEGKFQNSWPQAYSFAQEKKKEDKRTYQQQWYGECLPPSGQLRPSCQPRHPGLQHPLHWSGLQCE